MVYTFEWNSGKEIGYWYVQPFVTDCHTRIDGENTWRSRVRRGSDYGVLLARVHEGRPTPGQPGVEAFHAGGCIYESPLGVFPPRGSTVVAWTYVEAHSAWTLARYVGYLNLAVAWLLIVWRWQRRF
ncbi:MAG: hypothetical protein QM757_26150 [Paludibaculum sp.]